MGEDYKEGMPKDLQRKDYYIIKRWKGGKMKEVAVSQCPSRRMDMQ